MKKDALRLTRREALAWAGAVALPLSFARLCAQTAPASASAPAGASGADAASAGLPPDLVNLDPFMQWLAREHPPRMSFLDPKWKSLEAWKAAARPLFREHLSYEPEPVPLGAERVAREEREGFSVESVRIKATGNYDIPAWVLIPRRPGGRCPAVVAMHDHSGRFVWGHEKVLSSLGEPDFLTEFRNGHYGRPY